MRQFLFIGSLEGNNIESLRIDSREDMLDATILPSRIHGLNHNQNAVLVLRIEHLLQLLQLIT